MRNHYNWLDQKHYGHITFKGRVPVSEYRPKLTAEQKEAIQREEENKVNLAIHDHPRYI